MLHDWNVMHAGWQAHVQSESGREGARVSGSFEGKLLFGHLCKYLLLLMP